MAVYSIKVEVACDLSEMDTIRKQVGLAYIVTRGVNHICVYGSERTFEDVAVLEAVLRGYPNRTLILKRM